MYHVFLLFLLFLTTNCSKSFNLCGTIVQTTNVISSDSPKNILDCRSRTLLFHKLVYYLFFQILHDSSITKVGGIVFCFSLDITLNFGKPWQKCQQKQK